LEEEFVKARKSSQEIIQKISANRPCRIIRRNGREVMYRLYDGKEQEARSSQAITYVGKGKKRSPRLNGIANCEQCGGDIYTWDLFHWRLYGLCCSCFNMSERGYATDFVLVFRKDGRPVYRWHEPGGREESKADDK
jgi:hypothetical protein